MWSIKLNCVSILIKGKVMSRKGRYFFVSRLIQLRGCSDKFFKFPAVTVVVVDINKTCAMLLQEGVYETLSRPRLPLGRVKTTLPDLLFLLSASSNLHDNWPKSRF